MGLWLSENGVVCRYYDISLAWSVMETEQQKFTVSKVICLSLENLKWNIYYRCLALYAALQFRRLVKPAEFNLPTGYS